MAPFRDFCRCISANFRYHQCAAREHDFIILNFYYNSIPGLFAGFGLSGVIPAVHYASANGLVHSVTHDPMGWLVLMAFLYLLGAVIYAGRVPERWFLGKCDIWVRRNKLQIIYGITTTSILQGHSHQLFHVLVVAAALVNYHGIMQIAKRRLTSGECRNEL